MNNSQMVFFSKASYRHLMPSLPAFHLRESNVRLSIFRLVITPQSCPLGQTGRIRRLRYHLCTVHAVCSMQQLLHHDDKYSQKLTHPATPLPNRSALTTNSIEHLQIARSPPSLQLGPALSETAAAVAAAGGFHRNAS